MPDLDHLRIDGTTYDLKDSTAREKDAVQDNELSSLKSAKADKNTTPKTVNTYAEDVDLDIVDESGNVIVRFEDGHIKTKNFNSAFDKVVRNTDENDADLDFADYHGNVLMRLSDGNIQTKNFSSDQAEYKKIVIYNDAQGTATIEKAFPAGTSIALHFVSATIIGSDQIANNKVTYNYTDNNGISHLIGKDYGYNYFSYVLPEDAVSVSVVYGSGMLWGYTGTLAFSVYANPSYARLPKIITVSQNGDKDFTSLREAVETAAQSASDFTPVEIHVFPGTYNIMSDYTSEEINESGFVGLMITNGISLIGIGTREEIIISATLDDVVYDSTKRNDVSTLNFKGSVRVENLTIHAENIRYAIHDDFVSMTHKKNDRIIRNVHLTYHNLTTGDITYGAGGANMKNVIAKDCEFDGTFLVHNSNGNVHSMHVYLENCSARAFSFPDYDAEIATKVYLRNCKALFLYIANINGPHTQSMMVNGEGTKDLMVYCPADYVYNLGDCLEIQGVTINRGYAVKLTRRMYSKNINSLAIATDLQDVYGISIGSYKNGSTIVQTSGYISSVTLGLSDLSVGDYLTIDSSGAIISGGELGSAIARVVFVDETGIAFAKIM